MKTKAILIKSEIQRGSTLRPCQQEIVKSQPMLYRADINFALAHGGELVREFISRLWPKMMLNGSDIIVDSRVHMLMPGMWPCIPGWHHDDVPRERSDGQPEYFNPSYRTEHCMCVWGDCSLTEFALGTEHFNVPPIGRKIYKDWNPVVDKMVEDGDLKTFTIREGEMTYFDDRTWHRGMPTTHTGFRFFVRATRGSGLKPANEMRQNANVYMPVIEEGW